MNNKRRIRRLLFLKGSVFNPDVGFIIYSLLYG